MATLDAELEARSEEESDAGSLVDFICATSDEDNDESDEDAPVALVDSYVVERGVRRSTRRTVAPQRYIDPHYVDLMTEDANIAEVLSSSPSPSASDSDNGEESAYDSDAGEESASDSDADEESAYDSDAGEESASDSDAGAWSD